VSTHHSQPERIATPLGPSRTGSHFLGQFRECPAKHFYANHAPHPEATDSHGFTTWTTSSPLLVGSGVHEGLATLYRSRCITGEDNGLWDQDAAIAAIETHFAERRSEFATDDQYTEDLAMATRILREYHDFYGPGGLLYEWPDLKVVIDAQGPVIEREVELDLGGGFVFTARLDGLVTYHGRRYTFEHKTTAASSLGRLFISMAMNTQALGQHTILHANYPDLGPEGVLVNALVKNRAKSSTRPNFERQIVTFDTGPDTQKFLVDARRTLREIRNAAAEYNIGVASGHEPFQIARRVYEQRGRSTGACFAYSRCPYLDLCRAPGREAVVARSFKPRPVEAPTHQPEENDLA
jgi:hypothetical protein